MVQGIFQHVVLDAPDNFFGNAIQIADDGAQSKCVKFGAVGVESTGLEKRVFIAEAASLKRSFYQFL